MRDGPRSQRTPARDGESSMTATQHEARCIGDLSKRLDAMCQAAIEFEGCTRFESMTALAVVLWQHAEDARVPLEKVCAYLLTLGERGHSPEFYS
jgi:hypothetical protein